MRPQTLDRQTHTHTHTHTHTDSRDHNTFRVVYDSREMLYKVVDLRLNLQGGPKNLAPLFCKP